MFVDFIVAVWRHGRDELYKSDESVAEAASESKAHENETETKAKRRR